MLHTVSCVATSLQQAEELLERLERLRIPADLISCFLSERALDEDRILGRLQFEYIPISGIGRFFVAGPVVSKFQSATPAEIMDVFESMGFPPEVAREYTEILEDHHILIIVHCADHDCAERVRMGFRSAGAHEIYSSAMEKEEELVFA
jgi:hypothetical protein